LISLNKHGTEVIQDLRGVRKLVRKLIYIRNKILQNLKRQSERFDLANYPLSKEDHVLATEEFKAYFDNCISRNDLWKIDKRTEEKEYGSDVELSE